ncbi:methyl-accepting chemotaxis protein [Chitinolyticbacter meiyuanensis]|uniref:methyl-accepting chemotaxis protein n=1 Tax=Chitinolyticbacter meiyuanensis TaxID=682798 RepID=UPI0011E5ECB2|nr:methyl-accepting chemotaxis protein [Chitinolyticbacter meiyuanensis]
MAALKDRSLRAKVLVAAALAVATGFTVMIALIAVKIQSGATADGIALTHKEAEDYATRVSDYFALGYTLPQHLVQVVQAQQQGAAPPERAVVSRQIMALLAGFPGASGLWMVWEPNAFDGKDDQFRLDWPLHDPSGRYTPYVIRNGGKIEQAPLAASDEVPKFEQYREHPQDYKPQYEAAGWGDFYYTPKQRNRDTVTEPYPYEVGSEKVLMSSLVSVIRKDNALVGVAAVDLPLGTLQSGIGNYKPRGVGHVTLVSNGGLYVIHPDAAQLGKPLDAARYPAGFKDAVAAGRSVEFERDGLLHVYRPVKIGDTGQAWSLGLSVPMDAILADARAARNHAIVVGVAATLIILAVLATLLGVLTRPLARLAQAMEELSSGEGDLTRRLDVTARDEIGRTSEAFNRFVGNLQTMFREVRKQSDQIAAASVQLRQGAGRVAEASHQQAEAATATAASVQQVTVSIQHIADSTDDFRDTARSAGRDTAAGQGQVEQVAREIAEIDAAMQALTATMDQLGEQSSRVNHIVQAIRAIADQTNLLALNAAIEAARAGEQGRGFAVVADEVRQLAERTGQATVEIGGIVGEIQREITTATDGMHGARGQIQQGVAASRDAAQALSGIRDRADNLVENVGHIAEATREQAAASTDIAHHVERISGMAQQNDEAVAQVGRAVADLENLSSRLRGLVERFRI